LVSAGTVTFTASQAEVPEDYAAAATGTSNVMTVQNVQIRAPGLIAAVQGGHKWFGNSVHGSAASAGDRVAQVRNRVLYRDTLNIAVHGGGVKAVRSNSGSSATAYYEPAVLLDAKCATLPLSECEAGCVAYYVRSSRSYQNLLQVTRGVYEGRTRRMLDGSLPRVYPPPASGTNTDAVRKTDPSNPASTSARYNYLTLASDGGSTELLALSKPAVQNAAYDAARQTPADPARCMQYPPNPRISIAYGGGGCYVADDPVT
jgi:hypothetical protein